VASVVASGDLKYGANEETATLFAGMLYRLMQNHDFMPNSPTLTGAGTELGQLSACFVLPVGDSIPEIYDGMKYQALIHQTGGGTGFSFSRLREKGAPVRRSQGIASGPVSFMQVYNASTEHIKQGGTRRGANMGILRVDHPDILEFIECKSDTSQITNFNISVGITDAFMAALETGDAYELISPHNNRVVDMLDAKMVWDKLVNAAWATGEPGIVFLDRMNRRNPNNHAEIIEATNPCGEQPLPPYGSCNLGSINLANFVLDPYTPAARPDWVRLASVTALTTHFLDNVIDLNKYPLEQIAEKARRDRRIGLGVMGWAEMLVQLGIPYASEEGIEMAVRVRRFIKRATVEESKRLAGVRGTYPEYAGSQWQKAGVPMRNATTLTVAPTGTISILAARPDMPVSGGIEPKFALVITRNQAGAQMLDVDAQFIAVAKAQGFWSDDLAEHLQVYGDVDTDLVPKNVRNLFLTANEIGPKWHVRMQAAWQGDDDESVLETTCAAVSKTINFANEATEANVREAYDLAWKLGLKGITVYRDGSRYGQVLTAGNKTEAAPAPMAGGEPADPNLEAAQQILDANCHSGMCEMPLVERPAAPTFKVERPAKG
jgi:ribonucleoside-diphosphate reductase alpha chain